MGETILGNRYEIIRKVGDGGMAFVYEAKDRLLNRTVAVKVLRPEFVDDEEFLGKFKREAEAVASLSHPNIVNVYDVGEDGKVHYIVMEFIDGQNLKDIIKNEGTLDEYTALDITKQIAKALSAAHKKGIIHRDIKPHNILISNEGRIVKVADFGIAKAVSNSTMTNIGSIIGSVHYFSPEQAKGKYVTNNADLYSLGIVLYEMIIGKVPFRGDSPISIALQHINDEIEFTQEEKVNIPQSVRTIIKKLTEKSSTDRYQSAEELIEDIEYIEKNIDLDFIKEYDNYATQKIDDKELNKNLNDSITPSKIEEDYYYDEELIEEKPKNKKGSRKGKRQEKEDSPKTRKRLKIAAVVLILILAAQLYMFMRFLLGGPKNNADGLVIPNVQNMSLDDAEKELRKVLILILAAQLYMFMRFLLGGPKNNADGLVIPNVQNMSLDDAEKELRKVGLSIKLEEEYSADIEKNYVIYQTPAAGTDAKEGDIITIVLSKGPNQSLVPNIVGMSLSEAENVLKENKLLLGNRKQEYSDTFEKGIVIDQSPKSGNEIGSEGFKVDVVISKGPEPVKPPENLFEDNKSETTPNNSPNGLGSSNGSSNLGNSNNERPQGSGSGSSNGGNSSTNSNNQGSPNNSPNGLGSSNGSSNLGNSNNERPQGSGSGSSNGGNSSTNSNNQGSQGNGSDSNNQGSQGNGSDSSTDEGNGDVGNNGGNTDSDSQEETPSQPDVNSDGQ